MNLSIDVHSLILWIQAADTIHPSQPLGIKKDHPLDGLFDGGMTIRVNSYSSAHVLEHISPLLCGLTISTYQESNGHDI